MVTATISDEKILFFQQALGSISSSLNYLEWTFYSNGSGLTPIATYSLTDHKRAFFIKELGLGASSNKSLTELELAWWASYSVSPYPGYDGKGYDFFGTQAYDPIGLLPGLQAYYRADKIAGQTLVSDGFDRSKNLLPSNASSFETASSWGTNAGSAGLSSAQAFSGVNSLLYTTAAAFASLGYSDTYSPQISVNVGATYTGSLYVYSVTTFTAAAGLEWDGTPSGSTTVTGVSQVIPANTWTRLTVTGIAPSTVNGGNPTANVRLGLIITAAGNSQPIYIDAAQIEVGSTATKFTWGDASNLGVADTGQAWTVLSGSWGVSGGKAVNNGSSDNDRAIVNTGSNDHSVSVDFNVVTGNPNPGLFIRADSNFQNGYLININVQAQTGQIYKCIAGSYIAIGSGLTGLNLSTFTFTINGSTITVLSGTTVLTTITDTSVLVGTYAGIRTGRISSYNITYDNFSVKIPALADGSTVGCWPDLSGNNYHAIQNTYTNPNLLTLAQASFEDGTTDGWAANNGNTTVANSSAQAFSGSKSLAVTAIAAPTALSYNGITTTSISVLANTSYTLSVYIYQPAAFSTNGVAITAVINGSVVQGNLVTATGAWVRSVIQFSSATSGIINVYVVTDGNATAPNANAVFYVDAVKLEIGSTATAFDPNGNFGFLQRPLLRTSSPNLLTYNQATLETDTTGWQNLANATLSRSTTQALHGSASLQINSIAAGDVYASLAGVAGIYSNAVPIVVGKTYTALASFKSTVVRTCNIFLRWYASDNSFLGQTNSAIVSTTTGWTSAAITAVAPAGAFKADIILYIAGTAAANEVHYVDEVGLFQGSVSTWTPPVTIPNQRAAVQFDGFDDFLTEIAQSYSDRTIFVVAKDYLGTPAGRNIIDSYSGTRQAIAIDGGTSKWAAYFGSFVDTPNFSDTNIHIITATLGGGTESIFLDGSGPTTAAQVSGMTAGLRIGTFNGTAGMWHGTIEAIIIFNRVLSAAERIKVGRFLASRFATPYAQVQDSFNRADNASSLGTADSGQPWQALNGVWGISSNQAYLVTGNSGNYYATLDSGKTDFDLSVTLNTVTSNGICFRMKDSNNGYLVDISAANVTEIYRIVGGSLTQLVSVAATWAAGDIMRVTGIGANISVYRNGTLQTSASDTTIMGTKHGLRCYMSVAGTVRFDNFSVI